MPEFTSRGRRLHYREEGSGSALVILTGNTSSSAMQVGELAHFGRSYHAVALDYWGTGASERVRVWPDDWWQIATTDVIALLEHLGEGPAVLVGSSGGGAVALVVAALSPSGVSAVIADSCVPFLSPDWVRRVLAARSRASAATKAFWLQAHGPDWADVVAADSDLMGRAADAGGVDVLQGRLGEVRCPVLFTGSLRDEILPDLETQIFGMVRETAGSRLFLTDGGTHPLMWSRPGDFRAAADCFLGATWHGRTVGARL
jgi:valacyclovir hydrolase